MTIPSTLFLRNNYIVKRLYLVIAVILYVVAINWTYRDIIAASYESFGFSYDTDLPAAYLFISCVLSVLPSLWMPLTIKRPSLLLFYIQYFIMYIPALFILYHTTHPSLPSDEVILIVFFLFSGISIIQSIYVIPLLRFRYLRVPSKVFWGVFIAIMLILSLYLIYKLGGVFRLVSLEKIYEVRAEIAILGNKWTQYATNWLAGVFLSFCLAVNLFNKKWLISLSIAFGYIALFGISGSKTMLFAIIYIPLIYILLAIVKYNVAAALALSFSGLVLLPYTLNLVAPTIVSYWYIGVVNFRTFSIPQLVFSQYYEFFKINPQTYFSHIGGINYLINYPYDEQLSIVTSKIYERGNTNAGFWAGDGLAGFGLPGIVAASVLCAFLFWILDSISKPYNARFVAVAITFVATSFSNTPLSVTLLTGGLGILMLILMVLPKQGMLRTIYRD